MKREKSRLVSKQSDKQHRRNGHSLSAGNEDKTETNIAAIKIPVIFIQYKINPY